MVADLASLHTQQNTLKPTGPHSSESKHTWAAFSHILPGALQQGLGATLQGGGPGRTSRKGLPVPLCRLPGLPQIQHGPCRLHHGVHAAWVQLKCPLVRLHGSGGDQHLSGCGDVAAWHCMWLVLWGQGSRPLVLCIANAGCAVTNGPSRCFLHVWSNAWHAGLVEREHHI